MTSYQVTFTNLQGFIVASCVQYARDEQDAIELALFYVAVPKNARKRARAVKVDDLNGTEFN